MRLPARIAFTLFLAGSLASPAAAQWINHPTSGIPRTPDGKPDLTAPAPRTHDGTPDLSGVWSIGGLAYATNITDVEMLPWAKELYKHRLDTYANDDPGVSCLPEGPRAGIAGLDPIRIVQSSHVMLVTYESGNPAREVHLDGRPLPVDPTPTWNGYSTAHWDGDTLVIETEGYNDKTWLDFNGHPHSEALHVTERFRRVDFGRMQLEMTFTDPKTYVKPWTIKMDVGLLPDTDLLENVCLENEKDRARLVGTVGDDRKGEKKVARDVLLRYVGSYDFGPLGAWRIAVDGNQLTVQMADGVTPQPVVALSDTRFMFPPLGGTLSFVTDPKGVATDLILTIVEGDMPAKKVK
jgi:hypothetical protein